MHESTEALLARWVGRLRREEPRAVAILCHGSYARGEARAHSDLDLDVLIHGEQEACYRSAFEELPDGRLLHATIETMALAEWLEPFEAQAEAEEWSFFLAARQEARLLWATEDARTALEGRVTLELAAAPQLQDLIECAAKVRNAQAQNDGLGLRHAAHGLALRCPALLAPLNSVPVVTSPRAALEAALDLRTVPPGYREDMLICLGMSGQATTAEAVGAAALRLATGTLTLLHEQLGLVAERVEPGLAEALADGRLLRLLSQA